VVSITVDLRNIAGTGRRSAGPDAADRKARGSILDRQQFR
jgi:hypothetical protein